LNLEELVQREMDKNGGFVTITTESHLKLGQVLPPNYITIDGKPFPHQLVVVGVGLNEDWLKQETCDSLPFNYFYRVTAE
jgi:hypothetical protein